MAWTSTSQTCQFWLLVPSSHSAGSSPPSQRIERRAKSTFFADLTTNFAIGRAFSSIAYIEVYYWMKNSRNYLPQRKQKILPTALTSPLRNLKPFFSQPCTTGIAIPSISHFSKSIVNVLRSPLWNVTYKFSFYLILTRYKIEALIVIDCCKLQDQPITLYLSLKTLVLDNIFIRFEFFLFVFPNTLFRE